MITFAETVKMTKKVIVFVNRYHMGSPINM